MLGAKPPGPGGGGGAPNPPGPGGGPPGPPGKGGGAPKPPGAGGMPPATKDKVAGHEDEHSGHTRAGLVRTVWGRRRRVPRATLFYGALALLRC